MSLAKKQNLEVYIWTVRTSAMNTKNLVLLLLTNPTHLLRVICTLPGLLVSSNIHGAAVILRPLPNQNQIKTVRSTFSCCKSATKKTESPGRRSIISRVHNNNNNNNYGHGSSVVVFVLVRSRQSMRSSAIIQVRVFLTL